ncbi:lipid A deacylase LpxR family protein [Flavobacterium sp. ZT3R18]|uniref:lipid A deacylase LpxR family protein n=1 Tax=Flavobacterium sp. ZT3R18 TaxID=2594429 RepID=UPI00117A5E30|nr:lipid A deacylase LpxR family protein [Flavobacterium sp. ZT3R18]TRX36865.1 lipid A deacylase LpxR family protein [Flavobacterium sp. ZT3R18]
MIYLINIIIFNWIKNSKNAIIFWIHEYKKYYTVSLLFLSLLSFSQRIDNTASFRKIKSDHYFRYHYDNDFFANTDYYYTQGHNLELVSPKLFKNPINKLFVKLKNSEQKYGLSIEQIGFTPTSLKLDEILYDDRPFAAAAMLKSFLVSTDTIHKTTLSSILTIGIIGPYALGKEIQTEIHEWINRGVPYGWQYQIKNDLILNYEISHEKQLYRLNNLFALNSNAKLRLGTMNTNISGGLTTTFGKINSPFISLKNNNNFQIYGYWQGLVTAVGYDASLQGGLFNQKSPYVITDQNMERFTFQKNFGIVLHHKKLYLEYYRSWLSKEFETGGTHSWGGFRIGFTL